MKELFFFFFRVISSKQLAISFWGWKSEWCHMFIPLGGEKSSATLLTKRLTNICIVVREECWPFAPWCESLLIFFFSFRFFFPRMSQQCQSWGAAAGLLTVLRQTDSWPFLKRAFKTVLAERLSLWQLVVGNCLIISLKIGLFVLRRPQTIIKVFTLC